ncbi:hypothetical protein D3C85_1435760 [compost metagenome]
MQGGVGRVGEQCVDGALQSLAGAGGVAEYGQGQVGIVADHGLAGCFVDLAGHGYRGAGAAGGRCRGLADGCLVFAAAGEGDGDGQQAGGSQGHTNHDEFLCKGIFRGARGGVRNAAT